MIPPLRFLSAAALLPGLLLCRAQDAGVTAPVRPVAVVVDVSGSVSATMALEAREIILEIVAGRGFKPGGEWVSNFDSPEPPEKEEVKWEPDEALRQLYTPYINGTAPQKPLTGAGKVLYLAPIGSLETTLRPPRLWDLAGVEDFESLLRAEYPARSDQFKDGRTCYYIGVSRSADRLLQRSDEGCYLFVVSDEWDDPDSAHGGDWMEVQEKAGIFDVRYPALMKERYLKLKTQERFHLIARFHKGTRPAKNQSSGKAYLRLSWYAIGEKPQAVQPPPPPPPPKAGEPPPPPPPPPPAPPSFARSLTLLGGLTAATNAAENAKPVEARIKTFDHDQPFLAWQVDGVPAGAVDSPFQVTVHRQSESGAMEQVQQLKAAQLTRTNEGRLRGFMAGSTVQSLANGIYRVTIEEKPASGGEGLPAVAAWIEVKKPWNWVPWLLGLSVLGAAGVIGYSVWTLRR